MADNIQKQAEKNWILTAQDRHMEGNGRSLYPGMDANRLMMMSELTYKERQIGKQLRTLSKQYRDNGCQVKIAFKKTRD